MKNSVLLEKSGGIATIYLDEPASLNALSNNLKAELLKTLNELEGDSDINVIIITGNGRAFCAGGDVKAMAEQKYDPIQIKKNMDDSAKIVDCIRRIPKITISAIQGYAAGAGMSLALSTDLLIAEEDVKFVLSFKNVGLIPDLGLHYHLPRIVGEWRAKEWIWKGVRISSEEAKKCGFVLDVVPKGKAHEEAFKLAEELNRGPIHAYIYSKMLINSSANLKFDEILQKENAAQAILRGSHDHKEGLQAFREKRTPEFSGNKI